MYKTVVKAAALLQVLTILRRMTAIKHWRRQHEAAAMLTANDDYRTIVTPFHWICNVYVFTCKITQFTCALQEVSYSSFYYAKNSKSLIVTYRTVH